MSGTETGRVPADGSPDRDDDQEAPMNYPNSNSEEESFENSDDGEEREVSSATKRPYLPFLDKSDGANAPSDSMNEINNNGSDQPEGPPPIKRFRIIPKEEEHRWALPEELLSYLKDNIEEFIPEKDLQREVLLTDPVPYNCPKARKLDEFLRPFLSASSEKLDMSLAKIEGKLYDVSGPLSKVWKSLEDINNSNDEEPSMYLESMLNGIQKTLVLLGQSINATVYQRRLYLLSSICKDASKAKTQLKEQSSLFKSHENLFGSEYRKHVLALSKEREKSADMLKAMGLRKDYRPTNQLFSRGSYHQKGSARGGSHQQSSKRREIRFNRSAAPVSGKKYEDTYYRQNSFRGNGRGRGKH